jgi:hypothetical protein
MSRARRRRRRLSVKRAHAVHCYSSRCPPSVGAAAAAGSPLRDHTLFTAIPHVAHPQSAPTQTRCAPRLHSRLRCCQRRALPGSVPLSSCKQLQQRITNVALPRDSQSSVGEHRVCYSAWGRSPSILIIGVIELLESGWSPAGDGVVSSQKVDIVPLPLISISPRAHRLYSFPCGDRHPNPDSPGLSFASYDTHAARAVSSPSTCWRFCYCGRSRGRGRSAVAR